MSYYKLDLYKTRYTKKKTDRNSGRNRSDKNSKDIPSKSFRNSRSPYTKFRKNRDMYDVICNDCGMECQIPFEPKFNKPVYCSRCYEKNEQRHRSFATGDLSQNRYSRDDFSRKNSKTKKSKSEKFQKKQEIFYSNGSEKFYASIKEKLFELLGGKVCSSCGFKDERALGFNHIYDASAFDRIRRGGFASSWGKYISDPELARQELRVLCLNCNEIREPQRKTGADKLKPKKSRYFPR